MNIELIALTASLLSLTISIGAAIWIHWVRAQILELFDELIAIEEGKSEAELH